MRRYYNIYVKKCGPLGLNWNYTDTNLNEGKSHKHKEEPIPLHHDDQGKLFFTNNKKRIYVNNIGELDLYTDARNYPHEMFEHFNPNETIAESLPLTINFLKVIERCFEKEYDYMVANPPKIKNKSNIYAYYSYLAADTERAKNLIEHFEDLANKDKPNQDVKEMQ